MSAESTTAVTLVFTDLVNSTALKDQLPGADITARNRLYWAPFVLIGDWR